MVEKTIEAVCKKLKELYNLPVYTEPVVQGVCTPCFYVAADSFSEKRYIQNRRNLKFSVVITFIPSGGELRRREAHEMGNSLNESFKFIELNGGLVHCFKKEYKIKNLTRGFNRGFEITDEVLIFSLNINLFVIDVDESAESMYSLTEKIINKEN